jgi:tetratricopeptide (TPR) repeat protein
MSILQPCLSEEYLTEDQTIEMLKEGVKAGQEAAKIEPSYTRTWIFIAFFDNNLMQNQNDLSLEKDAVDSLQKAAVLSPYRFETYKEWARTYLIVADYKNALDKANECLRINPGYGTCDWYKALADLGLKNKSEYEKYLALAKDNGFDTGSDESLKSIIMIYIQLTAKNPSDLDSYKEMAKIYKQLSNTFSNNYQYHASLAFVYRALGDYADARIEAQKVLELSPESKQNVEDFLKTLPY